MASQLYDISFFISWRIERKQNPIVKKISDKATNLVEKGLEIKTKERFLLKKMDPDLGNPILSKFRSILENFKHEDEQVKIDTRHPFGIEDFCVEDRGAVLVGQYKITLSVLNKTASNYGRILPIILKRIMKIRIETKECILSVSDYRTPGMVKISDSVWPKSADTGF